MFSLCILTIVQRKSRYLYLFLTVLSLNEFLFFVFVFIAKKGGIPEDLTIFFYFNDQIKDYFTKMILTLGQLGYLMSIGRFMFPFLMMVFALKVVYPHNENLRTLICLLAINPIISLIGYIPFLFKLLSFHLQSLLMWFSLLWILIYSFCIIGLLIIDIILIRPALNQIKYFAVNIFGCFLTLFYLLYCTQDGAQIYGFYSYGFPWTVGLLYLRMIMSSAQYRFFIIIYVILALGGTLSLYFYISDIFEIKREQVTVMNRNKIAIPATHIFVHGLKNHFLVEQAYIRKIERNLPSADKKILEENIFELKQNNQAILHHLDELYQAFRYDRIELKPTKISTILRLTIENYKSKCPNGSEVEIVMNVDSTVMADKTLLSEAFSNLLVNSFEAVEFQHNKIIKVVVNTGFFNINILFEDNGKGLSEAEEKKIFLPFTSKKNSVTNWGMGLYFTNEVVKQHSGKINVESEINGGSIFKVILPRRRGPK